MFFYRAPCLEYKYFLIVSRKDQKIRATRRRHKHGLHPPRGVVRPPHCAAAKAPTSEKTPAVLNMASADFKAELLAARRHGRHL